MTNDENTPETVPTHAMPQYVGESVRALTAAARYTYMTVEGPQRFDFGETTARVLAAVAANLGGMDALLAGRPGSWEADHVRQIVAATVGDDADLPEWRTEPIRVSIDLYGQVESIAELYELVEADRAYEAVHERVRIARYLDHPAERAVAALPVMPLIGGDDGLADDERTAAFEVLSTAYRVVKADPEVQSALAHLDDLTARRDALLAAWRADMLAAVTAEAARRGYRVPVVVVDVSADDDLTAEEWDLSSELVDAAEAVVPLPGTDILPSTITDYDDEATRARIAAQIAAGSHPPSPTPWRPSRCPPRLPSRSAPGSRRGIGPHRRRSAALKPPLACSSGSPSPSTKSSRT